MKKYFILVAISVIFMLSCSDNGTSPVEEPKNVYYPKNVELKSFSIRNIYPGNLEGSLSNINGMKTKISRELNFTVGNYDFNEISAGNYEYHSNFSDKKVEVKVINKEEFRKYYENSELRYEVHVLDSMLKIWVYEAGKEKIYYSFHNDIIYYQTADRKLILDIIEDENALFIFTDEIVLNDMVEVFYWKNGSESYSAIEYDENDGWSLTIKGTNRTVHINSIWGNETTDNIKKLIKIYNGYNW